MPDAWLNLPNVDDEDRLWRRVFDWLKRLDRRKLERTIAEVTATSPLTIRVGGATNGQTYAGVAKLASYTTPTIGHRVYVIKSGRDYTVIGQIS